MEVIKMKCECPKCGEVITPEVVEGGYICPVCGHYFTEFDVEWIEEEEVSENDNE